MARGSESDSELAQKLVDQSQPQRFFQEVVDLLSWRFRAEGQEHIQATVNQVFTAHPTALVAMYLDWRRTVATERLWSQTATAEAILHVGEGVERRLLDLLDHFELLMRPVPPS